LPVAKKMPLAGEKTDRLPRLGRSARTPARANEEANENDPKGGGARSKRLRNGGR